MEFDIILSRRTLMAIPIRIDSLLHQRVVESTRIEFKKDFNPSAIIRTICAFANDIDNMGGGYILLGVEEKNEAPIFPISGIEQEKIDGILKKLREYCHYIEPLYQPVVEPVLYNGVYIIVIWVSGGYGRPYKAPKDVTTQQSYKYYYIRKFSSTVIASREEEKELFYISSNIPFDDRANLLADVSDLDVGLMRNHLKEIGSDLYSYSLNMDALEIANDLQIIERPFENRKPLNVGILMFSEKIHQYFRYARIEVVDIPDPTGTNMIEKTFTGPIQRQLKDALSYLKNYVLKEAIIKDPSKAESQRIYNYPYAAIEEILSNAVYHRSYQINEPITVKITPKYVEITSFPGFDRSISDKDIAIQNIQSKVYRNRRIGDFLKELHLIEGRNTGFPNAIKALKENGSNPLSFKMNPERDYLSVTIPIHSYFMPKQKISKQIAYEEKILSIIELNPCTLTELAHKMGYKGISAKLKRTVEKMVSQQVIFEIVLDKSIKYST